MFIIYATFVKTDSETTTIERVSNTFRKAGVSISITSFTDFIAFMIGIMASFKSVQIFCIYAGTQVFVYFNFQFYGFSFLLFG
jgi:hypothetical protein